MERLIRASDLATLTECDRRVYLDHHGDAALALPPSGYDLLIMQQGQAFEQEVVAGLAVERPLYTPGDLQQGFRATLALMQRGAPLIYQGVLMAGGMVGIPDLLVRAEGESQLGAHHYMPIDIKLASKSDEKHRLQMMAYMALLEAVQGVRPRGALILRLPPAERAEAEQRSERLHHEEIVEYDAAKFEPKLGYVRRLVGGLEPLPFISAVCHGCAWREVCVPMAEASQDASLIPGLRRSVWEGLHARGLGTIAAVAALSEEELRGIRGAGEKTAGQIIRQAQALASGQVVRLAAPGLPARAANEMFFDVESVPMEGFTYLLGTLIPAGGEYHYESLIARTPEQEAAMWVDFLDRADRLNGPVYHYGEYERTTVKALVARHGDDPRAEALLGRMIDLMKALKSSAVLPLRGYSLKDVAPWLGYEWTGLTQAADDSMVEFYHWQESGDDQHLRNIEHYNADDLRATVKVRDWLLTLE